MAQRRSRSKKTQYATIEGLQEFLKQVGVLPNQMARAEEVFKTIAAATVVSTAKQYAQKEGPQQIKYAETLRQIGSGMVAYGGEAGSMGAEFGSYAFKQFPEWRGNKDDAGYFFWPAIRNFRDEDMLNLWVRDVWTVVEKLFR